MAGNARMRRPSAAPRRLALLAANLEQVSRPLRPAAVGRRRTAMPAAGAGDRLCLVLVLVDDVLERLDGRGLDGRATVHTDSCADSGMTGARCGRGAPILADSADLRRAQLAVTLGGGGPALRAAPSTVAHR